VARQNGGEASVILPVWHGVGRAEVAAYSLPLADKLAVSSDEGLDEVVRRLLAVIQPEGSTLVIARDHLLRFGRRPPVISDDWWLDVAAAAEANDMEGGWQEPMGWGRWGFDWHNHYAIYNHNRYYSTSRTFYNRNTYYRGGARPGYNGGRGGPGGRDFAGNRPPNAGRGGVYNRPGGTSRPFEGDNRAARGYAEPHGQTGTRSSGFSNYDHGGETRSYSSRGSASFGGARGGGGGAPHGGGGGGGGRHH